MGVNDSSRTRVVPVFNALMDRDPTGDTWISRLLRLGSRAARQLDIPPGSLAAACPRWGCVAYVMASTAVGSGGGGARCDMKADRTSRSRWYVRRLIAVSSGSQRTAAISFFGSASPCTTVIAQ